MYPVSIPNTRCVSSFLPAFFSVLVTYCLPRPVAAYLHRPSAHLIFFLPPYVCFLFLFVLFPPVDLYPFLSILFLLIKKRFLLRRRSFRSLFYLVNFLFLNRPSVLLIPIYIYVFRFLFLATHRCCCFSLISQVSN